MTRRLVKLLSEALGNSALLRFFVPACTPNLGVKYMANSSIRGHVIM